MIDSNYAIAYVNRAQSKKAIKDYKGALKDYDRSIELAPKQGLFYFDRAALKFEMGDLNGAGEDWQVAKVKGFPYSKYDSLINEYCYSINILN